MKDNKKEHRELARKLEHYPEHIRLSQAAEVIGLTPRRIRSNRQLFAYLNPIRCGSWWLVKADRASMVASMYEGWIDSIAAAKILNMSSTRFHSRQWIRSRIKKKQLFGKTVYYKDDVDRFSVICKKTS